MKILLDEMDINPFDFTMDDYSTYPLTVSHLDESTLQSFQSQVWQPRASVDEPDSYSSRTPSLSRSSLSRSSSSDSAISSPAINAMKTSEATLQHSPTVDLIWPEEAQLYSSKSTHKRLSTAKSNTAESTGSSPDSSPVDPHHEGSCTRCRMTEAEARKCRLERRREQNRASQRKFRARKEAKIREAAGQVAQLEAYVEFLEKHNGDLEAANADLQKKVAELQEQRDAEPESSMNDHQTHYPLHEELFDHTESKLSNLDLCLPLMFESQR